MAEKQTFFYDPENNVEQGTHGSKWKRQYTILCFVGVVVMIAVIFTIPLVTCRNHKTSDEELNKKNYNECNTSTQNDFIENEKNKSTGEIVYVKPISDEDLKRYEDKELNKNDFIENKRNESTGEIVSVKPISDEDLKRYEEVLGELKSMGCKPRSKLYKVSDLLPKDSKIDDFIYDLQYVPLKKVPSRV
ncbi:uncharacterized protein LOC125029722 [Penaeus chinensis]|uniref:uncharacterized protein LOC125029722 n=1 Tax=Penaeus chinensis TaxID=139456 RepID=UPI001FB6A13D|nr:uncharacterized protein LOC125029722 [Penaeus chinensis]